MKYRLPDPGKAIVNQYADLVNIKSGLGILFVSQEIFHGGNHPHDLDLGRVLITV